MPKPVTAASLKREYEAEQSGVMQAGAGFPGPIGPLFKKLLSVAVAEVFKWLTEKYDVTPKA
jgi:hypothetical protein